MPSFDYLIVGGGLAGLGTAYHLAESGAGSILVVDRAPGPGREASGQNASMICRAADDALISRMTSAGADILLGEWKKKIPGLRFRRTGSLFIGPPEGIARSVRLPPGLGVRSEKLGRAAVVRRFPFLSRSAFESAVFFPDDGVVDLASLIAGLAARLKKMGVRFLFRTECVLRQGAGGRFEFGPPRGGVSARVVVNAAGAWAGDAARSIGAQRFGVVPRKRHLFLTRPLGENADRWPIVWDVGNGIYFRPAKKALLLSPCDGTISKPGPARVEAAAERLLRRKLAVFLPSERNIGIARAWAGLRTFSEDGRFVIGWDGKVRNFFWNACLDGHGLAAGAAAGRMSAALMLGRRVPPELEKAFSPRRFLRS